MDFVLYIVTCPYYLLHRIVKIGYSTDIYGRRGTYRTGCPPGFDPSHELEFVVAWKTDATSESKLKNYESMVHNQFAHLRLMRDTGQATEWFQMPVGTDPIAMITEFISRCPWSTSRIDLDAIRPRPRKQLCTPSYRNIHFCEDDDERLALITAKQVPVIHTVQTFLASPAPAATVEAPCGFGKTRIACIAMRGLLRVIICVPRESIQLQWRETLLSLGVFASEQILLIGMSGTTDAAAITEWMAKPVYCIITTYSSSDVLTDLVTTNVHLMVFDEAHHMAGRVATETSGTGVTRRLLKKACELNIKRLFLTFTPRNVRAEEASSVMTMDDEAIFGPVIVKIGLREVIQEGILPDYTIWAITDPSSAGTGIEAKAAALVDAWNATEEIHGKEVHLLHHLIAFTHTTEEARTVTTLLRERLPGTPIFHIGSGADCDDYTKSIDEYNKPGTRAILINCKMLGEGVDLPITNGVAILYPKQAVGDIVQTILRAGRWHKDKPLFHVLLPILEGDDMSGMHKVFLALAQYDAALLDELHQRTATSATGSALTPRIDAHGFVIPDRFHIETYAGSRIDATNAFFEPLRATLHVELSTEDVRAICRKHAISTSEDYHRLRETRERHLPENPLKGTISWYDFLHDAAPRMSIEQFIHDIIIEKRIRTVADWMTAHTAPYPSPLNIADGYFAGIREFKQLVAAAGVPTVRRGVAPAAPPAPPAPPA